MMKLNKKSVMGFFNNYIVPLLIVLSIPLINMVISIIYLNDSSKSWWFAFILTVLSCDIGALIPLIVDLNEKNSNINQTLKTLKIILLVFSVTVYTVSYTVFGLRKFEIKRVFVFTLVSTIIVTFCCVAYYIYHRNYNRDMRKKLNKAELKLKKISKNVPEKVRIGKNNINIKGKDL